MTPPVPPNRTPVPPNPDAPLIARLRDTFDDQLRTALNGAREVALVNFPNHNNPGDSLIWLGAEAALNRLNIAIKYRSAWFNFSPEALAQRLPDTQAPILINGGGNFGDLYGGQQSLRERLFKRHRDRPLIQLPQSIHFRSRDNLKRNRRLIAKHPNLTLMLRDQASFDLANDIFDAPALLAPDCAFGFGPLTVPRLRPAQPDNLMTPPDVLYLHRLPGDPEYVDYGITAEKLSPYTLTDIEWLKTTPFEPVLPLADRLTRRANTALRRQSKTRPRATAGALAATFHRFGMSHVNRGLYILDHGRILVTDKLHGHIMALLAGIPHVVLNNSYGKVQGAYEAWTNPSALARWADTGDDAVALAREFLNNTEGTRP